MGVPVPFSKPGFDLTACSHLGALSEIAAWFGGGDRAAVSHSGAFLIYRTGTGPASAGRMNLHEDGKVAH